MSFLILHGQMLCRPRANASLTAIPFGGKNSVPRVSSSHIYTVPEFQKLGQETNRCPAKEIPYGHSAAALN